VKPYYDDGQCVIYHGDVLDVLPELDRVGLCLTDPPYGVNYVSNTGGRRGKEPITNDGTRVSLSLYRRLIPQLQADHVLWFTRWDAWPDVWGILGHWFPMRGLLVWDKGTPGMGDLSHWGPSYELIASAGLGKTTGGRDQSILRFAGVGNAARRHPTEKPVDLLAYLIEKLQPSSVLDPFMGSGATLEASVRVGVPAIGIEIEERYCEIAAQRLGQEVLDLGTAA
jgi:site-specific DNA-methyltransferase (adenine-specific)